VEDTLELTKSVMRWVEKNEPYIERVVPIELAMRRGLYPVQAMVCWHIGEGQSRRNMVNRMSGTPSNPRDEDRVC